MALAAIVGTQVQAFGPQAFVCKPESDDERRRIEQDGHCVEPVVPRTWRQIPLTDDNFELTLPQSRKLGASVVQECSVNVRLGACLASD
jgi:hypothetical protein